MAHNDNQFQFWGRPNVLDLLIEHKAMAGISIYALATDNRGVVQGAFVGENFLGVILAPFPYHNWLKIPIEDKVLICLAPSLFGVEFVQAPFCSRDAWKESLRSLLRDFPEWVLICERDCDQEDILRFDASDPAAVEQVELLFDYLDGNDSSYCPTFLVQRG